MLLLFFAPANQCLYYVLINGLAGFLLVNFHEVAGERAMQMEMKASTKAVDVVHK